MVFLPLFIRASISENVKNESPCVTLTYKVIKANGMKNFSSNRMSTLSSSLVM